jgi:hypothetical protein
MRPASHTEHTTAATSPRYGTHASRLASLTTALTIALTLSLCGSALAAPMPTSVDSAAFPQRPGSVAAEQRYRDAHAAVSPRAGSDSLAPTVSSDDGLGAWVIVLISVGGVVALAGAAYTSTRLMHHGHGHALS